MKVLIVPNYSRPDAVEGARGLESWLDGQGIEAKWAHDKKLFPSRAVDASDCNLVGELHVSHRATLDIESEFVRTDGSAYTVRSFALNDFALSRGGHGDIVEFDVSVSGIHIDRLRGDGFVVSTATGSTGYALAAGGPIVTPEFGGMVCVPVAPHTIMARAFLTSPSDVVEIDMSQERPVIRHFFADGQPVGDEDASWATHATVRRGEGDILLLDHSTESFYGSVSRVFYGQAARR